MSPNPGSNLPSPPEPSQYGDGTYTLGGLAGSQSQLKIGGYLILLQPGRVVRHVQRQYG